MGMDDTGLDWENGSFTPFTRDSKAWRPIMMRRKKYSWEGMMEKRLSLGAEMGIYCMDKHVGLIFLTPLCQNGPGQTEAQPVWRGRQTVGRRGLVRGITHPGPHWQLTGKENISDRPLLKTSITSWINAQPLSCENLVIPPILGFCGFRLDLKYICICSSCTEWVSQESHWKPSE